MKQKKYVTDLTEGSVIKGILVFTWPMIIGQLLQQLYNLADAWVVGNYTNNASFAAVSSAGNLSFLLIGFFNGIAIGGGVVISLYFGAKDKKNVDKAVHTNLLFGIVSSVLMTIFSLLIVPHLLHWMNTPATVYPYALSYFRIYCGGVSTIIMYNIFMAIMRALGDSKRPLYFLLFSSVVNVVLDLLFVAVFHWGVKGAASATVISQGISVLLCIRQMRKNTGYGEISFKHMRFHSRMMKEVIRQGLPSGVQNAVISIGNLVVQTNVNGFGEYAISGMGAHCKIEGFVFIPVISMSMALSTFVSQNLGAGKYERVKKGSKFGILFGIVVAEIIGVIMYVFAPTFIRIFTTDPKSIAFGVIQARTVTLFYFLLSFSHCATGTLRGCGKSVIPMITMLSFWCGIRILYVTTTLKYIYTFRVISWAYPLTWFLSSVVFLFFMIKTDWGTKQ